MNVNFMYNSSNSEFFKLACDIEDKSNFNVIRKNLPDVIIDLYVILSDDITEIEMYMEKINLKKIPYKLLIITSNTDATFIIKCLDFTPYISYYKNEIMDIIKKIEKICK